METWQDIKDFFYPAVQDTEVGQMFFNATQVSSWANAALWEMAQASQYLDVVQEFNTVSGTLQYLLSSSGLPVFGIWRVEIDDEKIRAITAAELRKNDLRWATRSGRPVFYFLDDLGVADNTYIGFFEKPNGVYSARVYYYGVPAQVSDDADTNSLQVPQWAIYGVLWYMLSEAYLAETRRQNLDTSMFYRRLYDDVLERLELRANNKLAEKSWVMGQGYSYSDPGFWGNLPATIPEPA